MWNAKFANIYNKMETGEPISIDVRKLSRKSRKYNVYRNY